MSGYELRPLGLGELLDRAFLLYRRNFALFAGIMLIPACLALPMQFFILHQQGAPFPFNRTPVQTRFPAYVFAFLLVYWMIYAVAQGATTYAVADAYLGRLSTIQNAYAKIRVRFWRLMGVAFGVVIRVFALFLLVVVLAVFAGLILEGLAIGIVKTGPPGDIAFRMSMLFVLAGFAVVLWLAMRYAVSFPAVLLEDIKGGVAIRRSVQLSHGRRGQIFLAILLAVTVIYAVAFLFQGPFYVGIAVMGIKGQLPYWLSLGMAVSSSVGGVIAGPLMTIIVVLFYYDLRIRKEGFDLQHMMASLPQTNSAASSPLA